MLQPVCALATLTSRFPELMQSGVPVEVLPDMPEQTCFEALDAQHYALWVEAKQKHEATTRQLATYRLASLETSHRARLALLNEQFLKATDERIRRMRQSQITSAESDFARRKAEIERSITEADITAQPIAYGVMWVKH
jgi:hypothetical protein